MDRKEQIHQLRIDGLTYKQIGDKFGITSERVRQIEKKHNNPILKLHKTLEIRKCKNCGKEFEIYNYLKSCFCNFKCKYEFRINNPICRVCGSKENLFKQGDKNSWMCRKCNTIRCKSYYKENSTKIKIINREYDKRNPEKRRAWAKAQIIPLQPCEICGNSFSVRHHPDIDKPLEVRFLCRLHHKLLHLNKIMLNV
jgi:hypothetical protein